MTLAALEAAAASGRSGAPAKALDEALPGIGSDDLVGRAGR
jgi:hypothetical protein